MTIIQSIGKETREISKQIIRQKMPPIKMLHVDFYHNLDTIGMRYDLTEHLCGSGLQIEFIHSLGLSVCKKIEATALIIIGEKVDDKSYEPFIIGKCKNYWVHPIKQLSY